MLWNQYVTQTLSLGYLWSVDKPMVVAENTAMRPGIASLSQHMLNKDLTQFM